MTTPQHTKKPLKSFWRKLTAYFFLTITGILCFFAIIYSSPWGAQLAIKVLNNLSPVSLVYKSGMLSDSVEFSSLEYKNDNILLNAKNVALSFHLRCLWEKQLCINSLVVDELLLNVADKEKDEHIDDNPNSQSITLPIAIKADKFIVRAAKIIVPNNSISINQFSSLININQQKFTFLTPEISSLKLTYNTNQESAHQEASVKKHPNILHSFSEINLPEINLPIDLHILNLTLGTFTAEKHKNENESLVLTNTKLNGQWFNKKMSISSFSTAHKQINPVTVSGYLNTTENYPLNLQIDTSIKKNSIWPQISDSNQSVSIEGDLSSLKFNGQSNGTLSLSTSGVIALRDKNFPYSIEIDAQKIPLHSDVSTVLHPSALTLTSSGNIVEQKLSLSSVINGLGYTDAELIFEGVHSNDTNTNVSIEKLTLKDSKNDIEISGNFGLEDKPTWDLTIDSKGFTLPITEHALFGRHLSGKVKGTLNTHGVFDHENTTITVSNTNLSGEINKVPFSVLGHMQLNKDWQLNPSDLSVTVFNSLLKIKGYNDSNWYVDGQINTPQLNTFMPEVSGKLTSSFKVRGPLKDPVIEFNHNIEDFEHTKISSPLIKTQGKYFPFQKHKVIGDIESTKINWSDMEFQDVKSKINADKSKQHITLNWLGDLNSQLTVDSTWNDKKSVLDMSISEAEINYLNLKWLPNKNVIARYNHIKKQISVEDHCWENIGFNVCLSKDVAFFKRGDLPLSLTMNTSVLHEPFIPKDLLVNTTISGDVNVMWDPKNYSVTGDLSILPGNVLLEDSKLGLPVEILSAWDKGKFTFTVNNEQARTHLALSPNVGSTAWFYSTVNALADIKLTDQFPISGTISVNNFNLKPFRSISHDIAQVSGTLNSSIDLAGTLYNPIAKGKINITDGLFKLIKSPTVFERGVINIDLLGDNANVNGAFNVNEDTATIEGTATWLNEKLLNLNVSSDQLSILVPPQIEATIAPNINIKLSKESLNFLGQVHVLDGLLEINKLPEGSVELSKDVIFVDNQGTKIVKESAFNIESDISLFIDKQFKLSGQGFEGTLEGALRIQHGNHLPLQVYGNLIIPGGRYHAYGQRLQVEKGKVSFNGPADNPYVDLQATRVISQENIKVGLEITGLANALSLKLASTPSMSRAQTLSYLLRGQPLDLDSADNSGIGVAVGAALANYSGILKQIEKLPLLNNVEIGGSSEQVSIAGYIGKKVYVKYGIGADGLGDVLTIRLFLLSRLWLETISRNGSQDQSSADIYYSFDTNL
jgi:translocation and assembly module TamB